MAFTERYSRQKTSILADKKICASNRKLFRKFLDWEEYKLKRINGIPVLDERSSKTLLSCIHRLKNANSWFKDKPWVRLTETDIRRVYDALEEGRIKNARGKPVGDKESYYNKVFKSKPFALAGKADIARKVMEFSASPRDGEVRFIEESTFRKISESIGDPKQKALLWLAFDVGENIHTLLDLQKRDFLRQQNPTTKEPEYIVNLPMEKLKRSRRPRSEITHYSDTVRLLDINLSQLKDDDRIMDFGYRQALKFLTRAVRQTGARCLPRGQWVTWKDLRSSMACDLLKKGWSTDEIKARLGHKPSSRVLDKYVNYLAIGRHTAKKKLYDNDLQKMNDDLKAQKEVAQRLSEGQEALKQEGEAIRDENDQLRKTVLALRPLADFFGKIRGKPEALKQFKNLLTSG